MNSDQLYRKRRGEANSRADREVRKVLPWKRPQGRAKTLSTPDSASNSEGDIFCRLTRNRCVRRRDLFVGFEQVGTNRRADAIDSKLLQSRNHTHYVVGSVVETNIHYPTDSTLLGDGVRVLTRVMKKISAVAGAAGTRFRDRSRAVKLRVLAIARASRNKTESGKQKLKQSYVKLLDDTRRVVGQAKKLSREIAERVKRGSRAMLRRAKKQLDEMVPRVQQVIRQTKARVLGGNTHAEGKLLSVFETHTEVIRKGKTDKPDEFGKLIKIQEAENQIITDYEVYDQRPA